MDLKLIKWTISKKVIHHRLFAPSIKILSVLVLVVLAVSGAIYCVDSLSKWADEQTVENDQTSAWNSTVVDDVGEAIMSLFWTVFFVMMLTMSFAFVIHLARF